MSKQKIGIGLVGSGFMGRCHANAFRSVGGLFDLPLEPKLSILADADEDLARRGGRCARFRALHAGLAGIGR